MPKKDFSMRLASVVLSTMMIVGEAPLYTRAAAATSAQTTAQPSIQLSGYTVLNENVDGNGNKVFQFSDVSVNYGTNTGAPVTTLTIHIEDGEVYGNPPESADLPGGKWHRIKDSTNTTYTYYYKDLNASTATAPDANAIKPANIENILKIFQFKTTDPHVAPKITIILDNDIATGDLTRVSSDDITSRLQSLTYYKGHYYGYVTADSAGSNAISWVDAYNQARGLSFMGMPGYLATITSAEENELLKKITHESNAYRGWTGATMARCNNAKISITNPPPSSADILAGTSTAPSTGSNWYWACGPESGTDIPSYTGTTTVTGTDAFAEVSGSTANSDATYQWNKSDIDSTDVKGYFVEFGETEFDGSGARADINDTNTSTTDKDIAVYEVTYDLAGGEIAGSNGSTLQSPNGGSDAAVYTQATSSSNTTTYTRLVRWNEIVARMLKSRWQENKDGSAQNDAQSGVTDAQVWEPTRDGYTFQGWIYNGKLLTKDQVYSQTQTAASLIVNRNTIELPLTASWLQNYTLTVDPNPPAGHTVTLKGQVQADEPDGTKLTETYSKTYQKIEQMNDATASKEVGVIAKAKVTLPQEPEIKITGTNESDYTFAGWLVQGQTKDATVSGGANTNNTFTMPEGNLTIRAQWTQSRFTATYNANGGVLGDDPTDKGAQGASIQVTNPTRPGYDFAGWTCSNTSVGTDGLVSSTPNVGTCTFEMPDEDITLTAKWTPKTYTITYNLSSGTTTATGDVTGNNSSTDANNSTGTAINGNQQTYRYDDQNALIAEQGTVKRGEDIFLGWSTTSSAATANVVAGGPVTDIVKNKMTTDGSVTLYAVWKDAADTQLIFDANGGEIEQQSGTPGTTNRVTTAGDPLSEVQSSVFTDVQNTTRFGYTFAGWSTGLDDTPEYGANGDPVSNGDRLKFPSGTEGVTVLYAVWTPSTQMKIVHTDDGHADKSTMPKDYYGTMNQSMSAYGASSYPKPQPGSGYADWEFDHWKVYAYKGGNYLSSQDSQFKTWAEAQADRNYACDIADDVCLSSAQGGVDEGSDWELVAVTDDLSTVMVSGHMRLHAVFRQLSKVAVYFQGNSGTITDPNSSAQDVTSLKVEGTVGSTVSLPTATRPGYTLIGWTSDNSNYKDIVSGASVPPDKLPLSGNATDTVVNGEIVNYTAVWQANTYTIQYSANGASDVTGSASQTTYVYDSYTGNTVSGGGNLARDGYTLQGWSLNAQNPSLDIYLGEEINTAVKTALTQQSSSQALTLYPVWVANSLTSITFVPNGGKITDSNGASHETALTISDAALSPVNANDIPEDAKVTRDGYTFEGWTTDISDENAQKKKKDALVAEQISYPNTGSSTTYYAAWTPITYQLEYTPDNDTKKEDGSPATAFTENYEYDAVSGNITPDGKGVGKVFTRTGYTLIGWSTTQNSQTSEIGVNTAINKAIREKLAEKTRADQNDKKLVLYPVWQQNSQTQISFYPNGGKIKQNTGSGFTGDLQSDSWNKKGVAQTAINTGDIPPKDAMQRDGYEFVGWSTTGDISADDLQTKINGTASTDPDYLVNKASGATATFPEGGTTIFYAIWKAKQYTIKYNLNGGKIKDDSTSTTTLGDLTYTYDNIENTLNDGSTLVRNEDIFLGWSSDASGTHDVVTDAAGGPVGNALKAKLVANESQTSAGSSTSAEITLYAVWKKAANTRAIFDANGGQITYKDTSNGNQKVTAGTMSYKGEPNNKVVANAATPLAGNKVPISDDILLTLKGMLDKNAPIGITSDELENIPKLTYDGYNFKGWSTNAETQAQTVTGANVVGLPSTVIAALAQVNGSGSSGGQQTPTPNPFIMSTDSFMFPAGDVAVATYYAIWEPQTYRIRYHLRTSDANATGTMNTQDYTYGKESVLVSDGTPIDTENGQGGKSEVLEGLTGNPTTDGKPATGFSRPGYRLESWTLGDGTTGGKEIKIAAGGEIASAVRANITDVKAYILAQRQQQQQSGTTQRLPDGITGYLDLYANWAENGRTTVQFVANGGKIVDSNQTETTSVSDQGLANADATSLKPANDKMKRDGYTFVGWSQDNNRSYTELEGILNASNAPDADNPNYADYAINQSNAKVTFPEGGATIYYAIWKPKKYKIVYKDNAGNAVTTGTPTADGTTNLPGEQIYTYDDEAATVSNGTTGSDKITRNEDIFLGWAYQGGQQAPDIPAGSGMTTLVKQKLRATETSNPPSGGADYVGTLDLYAVWRKASETRIIFQGNQGAIPGATDADPEQRSMSFNGEPNKKITTVTGTQGALPTAETFKREGYTFRGWSLHNDAVYNKGGTVTIGEGGSNDTTFIPANEQLEANLQALDFPSGSEGIKVYYAVWQANTYLLRYDRNVATYTAPAKVAEGFIDAGDSVKGIKGSIANQTYTYGESQKVSDGKVDNTAVVIPGLTEQPSDAVNFSYPGYYLAGWALETDPTLSVIAPGAEIGANVQNHIPALRELLETRVNTAKSAVEAYYQLKQLDPSAPLPADAPEDIKKAKALLTQLAGLKANGISGSLTLYAIWEKNDNTRVQFVANGGSIAVTEGNQQVAKTSVSISGLADSAMDMNQKPQDAAVTRDGYTFAGWYTDVEKVEGKLQGDINFPTSGVTTYYAHWTPKKYQITYASKEGADGNAAQHIPAVQEYIYDTDVTLSTGDTVVDDTTTNTISRNEDILLGWSFVEEGQPGHKVDIAAGGGFTTAVKEQLRNSETGWVNTDQSKTYNGGITLYAVWRKPVGTRIIFDANQGKINKTSGSNQGAHTSISIMGEPNSKIGTLTPSTTTSGSTSSTTQSGTTGSSTTQGSTTLSPNDDLVPRYDEMERDGYKFVGWSTDPNASYLDNVAEIGVEVTKRESATTKLPIYEMTEKLNQLEELKYPSGKDGVTTYYAIWKPDLYQIIYDPDKKNNDLLVDENGNKLADAISQATAKINPQLYTMGTQATISDGKAQTADEKTYYYPGHYLAGWSLVPKASPTDTAAQKNAPSIGLGDEIGPAIQRNMTILKNKIQNATPEEKQKLKEAGLDGALTLYAIWLPNDDSRVQFIANGGKIKTQDTSVPNQAVEVLKDSISLEDKAKYPLLQKDIPAADKMEYAGYTFDSWNTKADGTGSKIVNVSQGQTAGDNELDQSKLYYPEAGITTYYAQWTPKKYKIKYESENKTSGQVTQTTTNVPTEHDYTYNDENAEVSSGEGMTRNEDIFLGWSFTQGGAVDVVAGGSFTKALKDKLLEAEKNNTAGTGYAGEITLYAVWRDPSETRISFNANGGTIVASRGTTTTTGTPTGGTVIDPSATTKTGVNTVTLSGEPNTAVPTTALTEAVNGIPKKEQMVRTGYTFLGWATNEKAEAPAIGMEAGQTLSLQYPTGETGIRVLYAVWRPNKYLVKYALPEADRNNGAQGTVPAHVYTFDSLVNNTVSSNLDDDGNPYLTYQSYHLAGWKLQPNAPKAEISAGGEIGVIAKQMIPILEKMLENSQGQGQTYPTTVVVGGQQVKIDGAFTLYPVWAQNTNANIQFVPTNGKYNGSGTNLTFTGAGDANFDNANGGTPKIDDTKLSRDGYTFKGWYSDLEAEDSKIDLDTLKFPLSGTAVYYAHWTPKAYTIKYDTNAGTGTVNGAINPTDYTYDESGKMVSDGTGYQRTGYRLLGWSFTPGGSTEVALGAEVGYAIQQQLLAAENPSDGSTGSNSITLYAVWSAQPVTMYFETAGGSAVNPVVYAADTADYSLPADPTRAGYTFNGWFDQASGGTEQTKDTIGAWPTSERTLYAQWTANTYTVRYSSDEATNGGAIADVSYTYDGDFTAASGTELAREGYTLVGWSLAQGSNTVDIGLGKSMTSIVARAISAENNGAVVTLYPVWQQNGTATLAFITNGGVLTTGDNQSYNSAYTITGPQNTKVESSKVPTSDWMTRPGYTFSGWTTQDELAGGNVDVNDTNAPQLDLGDLSFSETGATTYYAQWTPMVYQIAYDGSSADGAKQTQNVPQTTEYTYDDASVRISTAPGMTRNEDILLGWSFAPAGSDAHKVDIAAGSGVTSQLQSRLVAAQNGVVTLYAVWRNAANTRVVFNSNNGTFAGQSTIQLTGEPNTEIAQDMLPAQPTRTGYTLLGWAKDDSNATTPDTDAQTIRYPDGSTSITVYYAVWSANDYTIRYDGNGGTGVPADMTYTYDSATTVEQAYDLKHGDDIFLGWSTTAPTAGDIYSLKSVDVVAGGAVTGALKQKLVESADGSITLYAVWQKAADTKINFNANGGTVAQNGKSGPVITIIGTPGQALTAAQLPEVQEREGYRLLGWSKDSAATAGDVTIDENTTFPSTTVSVDTYYAVWEILRDITITLDANYEGAPALDPQTDLTYGSAIAPVQPQRDGYTFVGWSEDKDAATGNMMIGVGATDKTYYAIWKANDISFTFNSMGGENVDSVQGSTGVTVPGVPDAVRAGYDFLGWFSEPQDDRDDPTQPDLGEPMPSVFPSLSQTYYAHWARHPYTVTFYDVDPSDPTVKTLLDTQSVLYRDNAQAPSMEDKEGYIFIGWNTSFTNVKKDIEVSAMYRQVTNKTFIVRFLDDEGKELSRQVVSRGGSATAPVVQNTEDKIFTGWDKDFSNVQSSMDITAQYLQAAPTTGALTSIVFYGITDTSPDLKIAGVQKAIVDAVLLMPPVPAVDYYTTDGVWYTDPACTVPVQAGARVTENAKYYAKYVRRAQDFTFTNVDGEIVHSANVKDGDLIPYPNANQLGVPDGKVLGGWTNKTDEQTGQTTSEPVFIDKVEDSANTVVFIGADGKALSGVVSVGEDGKIAPDAVPAVPEKPGYVSQGWYYTDPNTGAQLPFDPAVDTLSGDVALYPVYTLPETRTVQYQDADGNPIGEPQTISGTQKPASPDDSLIPEVEGKIFVGWSSEIDAETGMETYKPVYIDSETTESESFVVTFVDDTGKVLSTQNVVAGESALEPFNPNRQGYKFLGWDKDFSNITESTTITALYELETMTVTFVDASGKEIAVSEVPYGGNADEPTAPAREGYLFAGWSASTKNVKSSYTVSPVYVKIGESVSAYNVIFYGSTGTSANDVIVDIQSVEQGQLLANDQIPEVPKRSGYFSDGKWYTDATFTTEADLSVAPEGDLKLYAKYARYTISFVDADGNEISSAEKVPGQPIVYPSVDQIAVPDGQVFTGFAEEIDEQTGVVTYVPQFVSVPDNGNYLVTFVTPGGTIDPQEVEPDGMVTELPEVPAMDGLTAQSWYYLDEDGQEVDFDPATTVVTSNLVLFGRYQAAQRVISYIDMEGNVISTPMGDEQTVDGGQKPTDPVALPDVDGKTFVGWDEIVDPVSGNITYVARYLDSEGGSTDFYTVVFQDWDGTVLTTQRVRSGGSVDISLLPTPTRSGYSFVKWDGTMTNVQGNEFVTALYSKERETFSVIFLGRSGELLAEQQVKKGDAAREPAVPAEEGWVFKGWDKDFSNIQDITMVKAIFVPENDENSDQKTVVFYNWNRVVLGSYTVNKGGSITDTPDGASKDNADFSGWDQDLTNITENMDVHAQFGARPYAVKFALSTGVTFVDANDRKQDQIVLGGETLPAVPSIKVANGYHFVGWTPLNNNGTFYKEEALLRIPVTGDVTYVPYVIKAGTGGSSSMLGALVGAVPENAVDTSTTAPTTDYEAKPFGKGDLWLNTTNHVAYLTGKGNGKVYPSEAVTRAEMATMLTRLLTDESRAIYETTDVGGLRDLSGTEWYATAAATMNKAGIMTGYQNGTFGGKKNITRAELAAIIVRFMDDATYTGDDLFSDINGHWANNAINYAASKGWLKGYENGSFRPNATVTRGEVVTVLNRLLHRDMVRPESFAEGMVTFTDCKPGTWYYEAIQEAANGHSHTFDENGYEKWGSLE